MECGIAHEPLLSVDDLARLPKHNRLGCLRVVNLGIHAVHPLELGEVILKLLKPAILPIPEDLEYLGPYRQRSSPSLE